MIKSLLTGLVLSSAAFTANAVDYTSVVADKSTILFTSKQMGVPVNGRFPKFTAQVAFDPARPEAAKIQVSVDIGAIDAGSKDANDEVVGKSWFNAHMFPMASFASSGVKALGGKFELTGGLTIKGKTQAIKAPFTLKTEGANGVFDGSFTIKRIDFGVGDGEWADAATVAHEVQITFHIVAAASAAAPAKSK